MPASQTLDHLETVFRGNASINNKDSSIHTARRTERSSPTALVQFITRTFRSQFGRPKEQYPEGSVELKPTKVIYKTCTVSERTLCDIHIYDVVPQSIKDNSFTKQIYYFCGGGWQSPPSPQHWQLCAKLARQLPETAISIVSYPLAPKNPAPIAFPWLLKLYRTLMQQAAEEGHRVVFAGDSSGANIVLSVILEALKEDDAAAAAELEGEKPIPPLHPHPTAVMVISPSTDLTRSNPEIEKLRHLDPLLTPEFIKDTAKAWRGEWDATDPRVSPINADISLFAKYGIRVHGVTGGYDILAPDAVMFRKKCEEANVKGEWLEWEKQMHCFVLTWPYGLREGREGVGWMLEVLKHE